MENKSHAMAAGLFVLMVSALVVGLAMWLTRDSGSYHAYELSSRQGVSGLQPQAVVRYKGVAVGKVTQIGFDPQISGNVLIRIAINDETPLAPTTFAVLNYQGVTGLAYVLLDDAGEAQPQLPSGPSGLPRLPLHLSPFSQLADQGQEILERVDEATQRFNQLLSEANQKRISTALTNIGQAASSFQALGQRLDATVGQRLDPALETIPALAAQANQTLQTLQQASSQTANAASHIGQAAQRLSEPGGTIDQAARTGQAITSSLERLNTVTLPRVERAADDTGHAARQLGRMAAGFKDNPQALIYGTGSATPGPGEVGFVAPAPAAQP